MKTSDSSHNPSSTFKVLAWVICLIAALNYSYDFFIRAAPGVMEHQLEDAFNIGKIGLGWLSSAYFISYTLMQIPAGIIIDRFDRKIVIGLATLLCVFGNFLFSATNHYEVAFAGRILMGVGSAFGFIGAAKMAAMWLPNRLYSTFIGFATIIGILGGLVTDTVLSGLVHEIGWKGGNEVFTFIGLGIFILIIIFIKDNKEYVEQANSSNNTTAKEVLVNLSKIFTNRNFIIASIIGATIFIPINVLGSLWGSGFVESKLHVGSLAADHINSILFIGTAIGFGIFAIIAPFTNRLRLMLMWSLVSMFFISIALVYIPMDKTVFISLYFLLGVMAGPQAVTFTIAKVMSPKGTSATSAAGVNMVNNLFPVILLPVIGYILANFHTTELLKAGQDASTGYIYALSLMVIIIAVAIPLAMLLPKNIEN